MASGSNIFLQEYQISTSGAYCYFRLVYDFTQNEALAQTTITYKAQIRWTNSFYGSGTAQPAKINNVQVGTISSLNPSRTKSGTVQIGTKTETIQHDITGTATANYTANFTHYWSSLRDASLSGSITLPKIPRATPTPQITGNIGASTTISLNRASTNFTHTIKYDFGTLTNQTIATNVGDSTSWTMPTSFYQILGNSASMAGTLKVETYNGSELIGTTTNTFTAMAPETSNKPQISTKTLTDTNSSVVAKTGNNGIIVKGISNGLVSLAFSTLNYATCSSVTINGTQVTPTQTSSSSGTTNYTATYSLNGITTNTIPVTIVDGRGFTTNDNATSTGFVDYSTPTVDTASFKRVDGTSGNVTFSYNGKLFVGSIGATTNATKVSYCYKKSTETSYGSWHDITVTGSSGTYTGSTNITGIDANYQYDFKIKIYDAIYTSNESKFSIPRGLPVVYITNQNCRIIGTLEVADNTNSNVQNVMATATASAFGRAKVINNVTTASHTDGNALSAYQGKVLKDLIDGVVLYENATGTTGDVTLSQTSANFNRIIVYYYNDISGTKEYSSETIETPNGKKISHMSTSVSTNGTTAQVTWVTHTISGTTMTKNAEQYFNVTTTAGTILWRTATTFHNYVYKVVGYK